MHTPDPMREEADRSLWDDLHDCRFERDTLAAFARAVLASAPPPCGCTAAPARCLTCAVAELCGLSVPPPPEPPPAEARAYRFSEVADFRVPIVEIEDPAA